MMKWTRMRMTLHEEKTERERERGKKRVHSAEVLGLLRRWVVVLGRKRGNIVQGCENLNFQVGEE